MGDPEGRAEEIIFIGPGKIHPKNVSELFTRNSRIYTAIIIGECEIYYEGRASSKAELGTRILIYKPDGSLLVHEGRDRDPLNWQPPGSLCTPSVKENVLEITCESKKYGYEVIVIKFRRILASLWCRLSTKGLVIRGTERDLLELLQSNPELIAPGASVIGKEVETPSGKIDLVLRDRDENIYVVEIKNEKAGVSAVNQLERYVEYLENSISRTSAREKKIRVIGVIVSPGVSERAREIIVRRGYRHVDPSSFRDVKYSTLTRFMKGDSENL